MGALGIGRCRIEHLLFEGDRIAAFREMICCYTKEQRQKGNHPAEMLVLGAMAMFLVAVNMKERSYLLIASVFVIFAAVLYLTGVLNPYSVMIRKIKKELKRFPKVPSYTEWSKPANADEKDS